jgi:wyosine [tRNA(Phe)-imidazoG37] synthetase (radical SAM superfamily)
MSAHLFGPVPSRRLGWSLGIDLVPFKTCTYDCVYCQLGPTSNLTCERREWVPHQAVLDEISERLARLSAGIDTITFSGSGEPTLHSRIGELIREVKRQSSTPVAVLTNGSLLWQRDVQDDLMAADLVVPSLDAPDEHLFRRVNRPCRELSYD